MARVPASLTEGILCEDCDGTGADVKKTLALSHSHRYEPGYESAYVRCWACNGNGLDPAEYFRWSDPTELSACR